VGGELYFKHPSGVLAMLGATGGEIRGNVTQPSKRSPSLLAKVGVDLFLPREQAYVVARYNSVRGDMFFGSGPTATVADVDVKRVEAGGGLFITRNILLKAEYVRQRYNDFPATDIRNGGRFDGFMIEGTVAF
jgi:hypothetical protein